MDKNKLAALVSQGLSIRKIAQVTGKSPTAIRYWMKKYELKSQNINRHNWDIDELRAAALVAKSKRDLLHRLNLRDSGSIYIMLNKLAMDNGITLPQHTFKGSLKPSRSLDELFSLGSATKGATLRKYMVNFYHILYECKFCKLHDWQGAPLVLEVDHIDGNHQNNVIENLRFLCPNCHAQTETYSRSKSIK